MMTLKEMAAVLGAHELTGVPPELADSKPRAFRTDSRAVEPGDVFVCIPGEKVDGHDYALQALEKGAAALVVQRRPFEDAAAPARPFALLGGDSVIGVITRLAVAARERTKATVVGITGTAGKTSVKEVLSAVLSVRAKTSKNYMNMNSQIGLAVSILNAAEDAGFWVLEAGISEARDMDELAPVLKPDLGIILNIGPAHLSGLGDRGVAYYKSRLLAHLNKGALSQRGLALVSADYPDLVSEARALDADIRFFSTRVKDADYFASYLGPASAATGRYMVSLRGAAVEVVTPFRGGYGSENVAAIAGAAHLLGLGQEEIVMGLAGAVLPAQRFVCETRGTVTMIDDSYNANPLSSGRMLEAAAEMAQDGDRKLIPVMGEMLELGESAADSHRQLGRKMAEQGAALVVWKGGQAEMVEAGLREGGFKGDFYPVNEKDKFAALLKEFPESGFVTLFKGSRGTRLEEFAGVFRSECLGKIPAEDA